MYGRSWPPSNVCLAVVGILQGPSCCCPHLCRFSIHCCRCNEKGKEKGLGLNRNPFYSKWVRLAANVEPMGSDCGETARGSEGQHQRLGTV